MRNVIHRLRERPHHERRVLAAFVAISTSGVLLVGWFAFVLRPSSGGVEANVEPGRGNAAAAQVSVSQASSASSPPSPLVQYLTTSGTSASSSDSSITY